MVGSRFGSARVHTQFPISHALSTDKNVKSIMSFHVRPKLNHCENHTRFFVSNRSFSVCVSVSSKVPYFLLLGSLSIRFHQIPATMTTTTFMEEFDRVSMRVGTAGMFGAVAGVGTALYKGYPIPRTAGLTYLSCAMVASACFTSERIAAIYMRGGPLEQELGVASFSMLTHACGGFVGGGIVGALYISKPLHGIVFFTPIMTVVGFADSLFQELLREQKQRILAERESLASAKSKSKSQ